MKPANCKCSDKGRNLVVCIDGTSNQFGERNTNVVELYSKIVTTEGSKQLTYYNSGIGTYAKPWKSVKYLLQLVDNTVDLAIAWNFEKIIIGAYRWLSHNYQENDRIFLFGFSRGAYQVRALAGMIHRVGLLRKGNEEQIPFAYELYATRTAELADSFKNTFSRENVRIHFVGVWDTVSSVGVIRGKTFPLTDSAEHICFFRHALALDERRVKFLPEYVHGGLSEKHTTPERPKDEVQIHETGVNPSVHIKEVWFPGTHSDVGGGNQLNRNLDLGGTPFLWMSFEAVSCGLRLRPTRIEWPWENLHDKKESLTGVWHLMEWLPFKRLSYKDESSTVFRPHKGRGRKIKPGQKVHSSIAFCKGNYQPKAILPEQRRLSELVGKGKLSHREWVKGWEDFIEMDIFDLSLMSNIIETLKSGTGGDSRIWAYRLKVMTSTDEGLMALRNRPNIMNDLVQIFTGADQPEVHQCVTAILAKIDSNTRGAPDETAGDEQHDGVPDSALAMFKTVLSQNSPSQLFAENTISSVRKRFTADDPYSQDVAKRVFGAILENGESRQHVFDSDVLHSFLNKIDDLNDTDRSLFALFLANQYKYLPKDFFAMLTSELCDKTDDRKMRRRRYNILLILRDTIDSDGLRKRLWNRATVKALQKVFNQVEQGLPVRSLVLELYKKYINHEGIPEKLFDTQIVTALGRALNDEDSDIRSSLAQIFTAAISHECFRDDIVDPEILTALVRALGDDDSYVRRSVVDFFTTIIAQEGFRDIIVDPEIVAALVGALGDEDSYARRGAVNFFTATIAQEGFRDEIFDTKIVAALLHALLGDKDSNVRISAVQIFTAAIAQEGFRDKIFDIEIVAALVCALSNEDADIRRNVVKIFTSAVAQEGFRDKTFDAETITALVRALGDEDFHVRGGVVNIFIATIAHDGFRDKIFDTEIIVALVRGLGDKDASVRISVAQIFTAALAQEGFRDNIVNTEIVAALVHALGNEDWDIRSSAVNFFTTTIAQEGFRDKIFNTEIVTLLVTALGDKDSNVRISMIEIFTAAIAQDDFRDKIFDTQIHAALVRALSDEDSNIRSSTVNFFAAAIAQNGFRDKIFDAEIVAALVHALGDGDSEIRSSAVNFFTAAVAQDGCWDKIFDTEILAALVRALSEEDSDMRRHVLNIFTSAIPQDDFWDKLFDTEILPALVHALSDEDSDIKRDVVKIFTSAIPREGFRDKIFDTEIVAALVHALGDKDSYVKSSAGYFFTAAIAQERVRNKTFDKGIVAALVHALNDEDSDIRRNMVEIFIVAIAQEGFRDKIFDTEIVTALIRALSDTDSDIRRNVVEIFTTAIAQEGFRDKIFDTETVAALVQALADTDSDVRRSAVNFFTVAIAQDGFRDKIFDAETVAHLIATQLTAEFWSHEYIHPRAFNHFITSTLCEQLTSVDLSLRDQTRCSISEAIKHDDVHTRICTAELRKHFHCPRHASSTST